MRLPTLSPTAYRRITLVTLVALCAIIVSGGLVRLTGSGLGCSDWPNCQENQFVAALDKPHEVVEFVNRAVTGLISVIIIVAVLGALIRRPRRPDLVRWALGLIVGLVGNIVLGGVVVLVGLKPGFVTGHFLLSIFLVWNAFVLHQRAGQPDESPVPVVPHRDLVLGRVLVAWCLVVLCTGTVVTGAGPHAGDEKAERWNLAISEVARVHGIAVWVFLALTALALWRLTRDGAPAQVLNRARTLLLAIAFQGAIGYTQYFTGIPIVLVALHLLGATLVWLAVLAYHLGLWTRPESVPPSHRGRSAAETAPNAPLPA